MKTLQGQKYKWETVEEEEGNSIPGTNLYRGSRVTDGTVLGLSDNKEYVGVIFDYADKVSEYTLKQFVIRFGHIHN